MNASRPVAALAAVAIGFGVTLVGVALADDDDDASELMVDQVNNDDADDDEIDDEPRDDDIDDDEDGTGDVMADDAVESEDSPASDEGDDAVDDIDGGVDASESESGDGPAEERDPDAEEPPETVPTDTTVAESPTPRPPATDAGDVFEDLGEIKCVDTISVEYFDGARFDFVVAERGSGGSWLVIDVDGVFELSVDDPGVARITEVRREVLFAQGAAVDFFDTCDDLGGSLGTESDNSEFEEGLIREFPCSPSAQSTVRELLDESEVQAFDDLDEFVLAVAIDLAALGRRSEASWFDQLDGAVQSFRTFDDGCSELIETEFERGALLCAAPLVVAGNELSTLLQTVAPAALGDCLYDLTLDGDS